MAVKKRLKSAWTALWKSLSFVVMWGVLYAPVAMAIGKSLEGSEFSWIHRVLFDGSALAAILLAAWIMVRLVDRRGFVSLGFASSKVVRDTFSGFAIALVMVSLTLGILWAGGWAESVTAPSAGVPLGRVSLAGLAILLNAALQELLCRSYMFQTIQRHSQAFTAVLLTSLIFVLLHAGVIAESFLGAVNLFAAGVLLGLAYLFSGNLWLPIALHFAWNFMLGPVLGLTVSGQSLDVGRSLLELSGPDIWSGGGFGVEASLAATIATAVGIAILVLGHTGWPLARR